jgi:hypothetical protein
MGERKPADRGYRAAEQKSRKASPYNRLSIFISILAFLQIVARIYWKTKENVNAITIYSRHVLIFAWRMSAARPRMGCSDNCRDRLRRYGRA